MMGAIGADIRVFQWPLGAMVRKRKGSSWRGRVVGFYSTSLTPVGYCVESAFEGGSVQIYPESALEPWDRPQPAASEPFDVSEILAATAQCAADMEREDREKAIPAPVASEGLVEALRVGRYLADRFLWAAPGDQQEDAWLLRFCDNDVRDVYWHGEEAETDAWAAWNWHAPGYNCYLFRLASLRPKPDQENR